MRDQRTQSGLSLHTLLIAGAASAAAAFLIPLLWEPGTLFAAAMTPIIVALVTEALKRPAETVKGVRAARRSATREHREDDFDPLAPPPPEDLEALPATTTRRTTASSRGFRLTPRQWRLGLATGALAFVLAVAFVTASELLAGEKVGGSGNPTTFFSRDGAGRAGTGEEEATPEATREPAARPTTTPEAATPAPTATPAPAQETPAPTATPTPATTPAPLGAEPTASPAPAP